MEKEHTKGSKYETVLLTIARLHPYTINLNKKLLKKYGYTKEKDEYCQRTVGALLIDQFLKG